MHIRFEEDDVDSEAMETYADEPLRASQLTFSAQPNETPATLSVATSARVDFGSEDECYVYNVVNRFVGGSLAVAASLSNRRIKLYAGRETTLSPVGDLIGHQGNIQDIAFALPEAASTLHSCALDGTVRGWEIRTKQEVERLQASGRQLFSVSAFDNIVAAGSNSEVLFWDRRTGKLLQSFQDAHAEEVTQVKFHPEQPNTFLTASTDGLINVYNTSSGLNEDDGFQACLNTGNSAAEVGFYGPRGGRLWCRTHTEGLHLWDWAAACSEEGAEGSGAMLSMENFRQAAGEAAAAAGVKELAGQVDYVIGCTFCPATGRLWANAGSNQGSAAVFPVMEAPGGGFGIGCPSAVLAGGHSSVVRCLLRDGSGTRCITAGEDARLCVWDLQDPSAAKPAAGASALRAGSSQSRPGRRADQRHSPY